MRGRGRADRPPTGRVLVIKAEDMLHQDREDHAREALERLPAELDEAGLHVRAGVVWLELGEHNPAAAQLGRAIAIDSDCADAHYWLGRVNDARGDRTQAIAEWLETRLLDLATPRPDFTLRGEDFDAAVEAALEELPADVRPLLRDVPILDGDYPNEDLVRDGQDPRVLGIFAGTPYPFRHAVGEGPPTLDCVFIYQRNIERLCLDAVEAAEQVGITMLHEAGHFFGLDEAELERRGLG